MKEKIKKIKKKLLKIDFYILNSITLIFYYLSLSRINGIEMKCFGLDGVRCYYILGIFLFISSLILSIIIFLSIIRIFHKYLIFTTIILYIFVFVYDHETSLISHGFYNFIGLIITTSLLEILLFYLYFLYFLIRKKKYIHFFIYYFF